MANTTRDEVVSTKNGYQLHYCKTDNGRTYIYNVPAEINEDTKVVIYIPGTGGAYPEFKHEHGSGQYYIDSMIENNDNCILIIPKDAQDYANTYNINGELKGVVDSNNIIGMVQDVLDEYGLDSNRFTTNISWSNGTTLGLKVGAHFLELEGPNATPMTFMLINSAGYTPDMITSSELQAIADSNSNLIIMSEQKGMPAIAKYQQWGDDYGINLYGINCNNHWGDKTHSQGNSTFAKHDGLSSLLNGTPLALPTLFTFTKYNSTTHKWENITAEEMSELIGNMTSEQRTTMQSTYNSMLNSNYSALSKVSDVSITNSPVSSNYDELVQSMNNIRDLVRKQSESLSSFSFPELKNGNQLLSNVGIYISNCSAILFSMLDSLTLETESIISYGQALVDMENDIEGDINKITMLPLPDNYSAVPDLKDTKTNDGDNAEKDKDKPQSRRHGNGNGSYGNGQTNQNTKKRATYFKCNDGSDLLATFDGNEIIKLQQKYTCNSEEELEKLLEQIKEKYSNNDFIESINKDGNAIIINFNKSLFANKNINDVLANYFNGGNGNV